MAELPHNDEAVLLDQDGEALYVSAESHVRAVGAQVEAVNTHYALYNESAKKDDMVAQQLGRTTMSTVESFDTAKHHIAAQQAEIAVGNTLWQAHTHYKQNEAVYQEAAYQEAQRAGHANNFLADPYQQAALIIADRNGEFSSPEPRDHA